MALIKLGHIVSEIRGKLNGSVFARNRSGAYVRAKVSPLNPETTFQSVSRALFTQISQSWRGLTEAQRLAWNAGSVNFSRTNVFGDNAPLSGFGLFMRLNGNLLAVGESILEDVPTPSEVFGFLTMSAVVNLNGAGTMTVAFTPAIPAGTSVIVYASPGISPGKSFVKSELRKIDVLDSTDTTPADIKAAWQAKYGSLPEEGQKVFFQLRPVDETTGMAGTKFKVSTIVVDAA